jgi:hypothetical protein
MLLEFPHENAGLEALHFHEETKQVKVRLLLALSELSKQNFFQLIEGLIWIIADIIVSKMSRRTCLGKLARALAYLSLCDLIPAAANWAFDEAEPDVFFLFIVWTKFHLRSCGCRNGLKQVVLWPVGRNWKGRWNPKYWETFILRGKNGAATVGQNQHMSENKIFSVFKIDTQKIRGLHRVKIKTRYKNKCWVGCCPGSRRVAAAETEKTTKTVHE